MYVDSSISVLTNLVIKKLMTGEYENAFWGGNESEDIGEGGGGGG